MKKEIAITLMDKLLGLCEASDLVGSSIEKIEDEAEFI